MNIFQLKQFVTITREGTVSEAAKLLGISQPALSTSLSRLEQELEVNLFTRTGKRLQLNKYGKIFLKHADKIITHWKSAHAEASEYRESTEHKITIGISCFLASQNMVFEYQKLHPETRLAQYIIFMPHIPGDLYTGNCDLIITTIPVQDTDIEIIPLLTQTLELMVPINHRFANYKSIKLIDAKDEPFVSMPKGYVYRETTDILCRKAGFEPKIAFEHLHSQIIPTVAKGIGISLGIRYEQWMPYNNSGVRFIPISEPVCTRKVNLLIKKDGYKSTVLKDFISFAIKHFKNPPI
jgi:DNA-binding transcriptional LysR family regulator